MICLTFGCGGCHVLTDPIYVQAPARCGQSFRRVAENVLPEGWVAFDPWTQMVYCPTCWADLLEPSAASSREPGGEEAR